MRTINIIGISLLFLILFSCSKEDNIRQKYAGPKKISHYQWIKADTISGEFTQIIYDMDTLGEVILWDNSSDTYNNAYFYTSVLPAGFGMSGVGAGGGAIGWYMEAHEEKSLTFFSEPNAGNVQYCTYTLKKRMNGKIILEAVFGSGTALYKEIIELTPISED